MSSDSYQLKFHRSEYASIDQISTDSPKKDKKKKESNLTDSDSDSVSEERILSHEVAFGNIQGSILTHSDWDMESEDSDDGSETIVSDGKIPVKKKQIIPENKNQNQKNKTDIFLETPKINNNTKQKSKKHNHKKTECIIDVGIPAYAYDLTDSINIQVN